LTKDKIKIQIKYTDKVDKNLITEMYPHSGKINLFLTILKFMLTNIEKLKWN